MFRFSQASRYLFLLFASFAVLSTEARTRSPRTVAQAETTESTKVFVPANHWSTSLSYTSWKESVGLSNASATDSTSIDFYGFAWGGRWEHSLKPRQGFELETQLMYGQAGMGQGKAGLITTSLSRRITWWGMSFFGRYAYKLSNIVTMAVGPMGLHRQVSIPGDSSGVQSSTNAEDNFGLSATIRVRLTKELEMEQSLASLTNQNTTLWAFGLGYRF